MIFNLYYLSYGLLLGSFIMYTRTKPPIVFTKTNNNERKIHMACLCSNNTCSIKK